MLIKNFAYYMGKLLEHFNVTFSGNCDKDISQSPKAGTSLEDGSYVKLMLG